MKQSLVVAALSLLFAAPHSAQADVLHQDHIVEDTTWRASQGDHIVIGQITVLPGATLTIEPGVTIRGYSEFPFGTIVVRGALEATGTVAEPVVFTRHHATGNWQGLGFDSGAQATLENCEFRYAKKGVAVYWEPTAVSVTNCLFELNEIGVFGSDGPQLVIRNCLIQNNFEGVNIETPPLDDEVSPPTVLEGSTIINNEWAGVHLEYRSTILMGSFQTGNNIYGNGTGQLGRDFWNGSENVDAPYVYWGVLAESEVFDRIFENGGNVEVCPWTNEARDANYCPLAVGTGDEPPTSRRAILHQNSPNPFNPSTEIRYELGQDSWVELSVFDLAGRRVLSLYEGFQAAGERTVPCDARTLGSGTYVYRLRVGDQVLSRKMVVLK
jgi:hypothetical protein